MSYLNSNRPGRNGLADDFFRKNDRNIERYLNSENEFTRQRWGYNESFIPTIEQIDRGLRDQNDDVSLSWILRRDFIITREQVEHFLTNRKVSLVRMLLERMDWTPTNFDIDSLLSNKTECYGELILRQDFEFTQEQFDYLLQVLRNFIMLINLFDRNESLALTKPEHIIVINKIDDGLWDGKYDFLKRYQAKIIAEESDVPAAPGAPKRRV